MKNQHIKEMKDMLLKIQQMKPFKGRSDLEHNILAKIKVAESLTRLGNIIELMHKESCHMLELAQKLEHEKYGLKPKGKW